MVFPEPLIPENKITKGFDSDFFIFSIKFGGLIRIDSIEFFSSSDRLISFRVLPTSFSARDSLIDSTAEYATLFCKRIISSSSKSSSNFSSVNFFLNFIKKLSSAGVSIVFLGDCSGLFFGFFLVDFFLVVTLGLVDFLVGVTSSLFFVTQVFSFSFSAPNMVF